MIRRPPRSTPLYSSAASDVYKRQPPPFREHRDGARAEPVADRLQPGRVSGAGKAVRPGGQGGDPDARLGGLTLGPVVSIEPDLDRVREVCTDFDEARAEVLIPQVEVVRGDPPIGLTPGEVRRATLGADRAGGGGEHPLELLRYPDRGHPRPAGGSLAVQMG